MIESDHPLHLDKSNGDPPHVDVGGCRAAAGLLGACCGAAVHVRAAMIAALDACWLQGPWTLERLAACLLRSYGSLALGESLTSLMTKHAHSRNVDLYM